MTDAKKVEKFLNVPLYERCRKCQGSGRMLQHGFKCSSCEGEGYSPIGMTLLDIERLRARATGKPTD